MAKNVLIISGSPRKNGNSDTLCNWFKKGAEDAGNVVEKISVADININYCRACYYCLTSGGKCAINDDMGMIIEKIMKADVIVLASPVYFYSISAQLKTIIDRSVSNWTKIKNKEFYFILTSAEDSKTVMDCSIECLRGYLACLSGSREIGGIYAKGVYKIGDIENTPYLQQAYGLGTRV